MISAYIQTTAAIIEQNINYIAIVLRVNIAIVLRVNELSSSFQNIDDPLKTMDFSVTYQFSD
jgi:hypothetical protein